MMMTTKEVAELMRVSTVTVRNYFHAGALKGVQLSPKRMRFARSDVETFLNMDKGASV